MSHAHKSRRPHVAGLNEVMLAMQDEGFSWMIMSYIWLSHASHMNESCTDMSVSNATQWQTWWGYACYAGWSLFWVLMSCLRLSHVSRMNESCTHISESCHTWISHVAHLHESCRTYNWVIWIMDTYQRVMSHTNQAMLCRVRASRESRHTWISHVSHMNESCRTYEIWMSHVSRRNESCLAYECGHSCCAGWGHSVSHGTHA